jgi:hypothetical protein
MSSWCSSQVAGGVDRADVEVWDEQDVGSGVGSADAVVVQPLGEVEGDAAAVVDAITPAAVVVMASPGAAATGVVGGGCTRR